MYQQREHFLVEDLTMGMRETLHDCSEASQILEVSEKRLVAKRMKNEGPKWYKFYNGRVGYRFEDMINWLVDKEKQHYAKAGLHFTDEREREIIKAAVGRYASSYSEKVIPMPVYQDRRAYGINVQVEQWVNI